MPTMETGRGAEPGLLAADWAALEFVTWWKIERAPLRRERLTEPGDLLVGRPATWSTTAAPRARQRRRPTAVGLPMLDAEVAAVGQLWPST